MLVAVRKKSFESFDIKAAIGSGFLWAWFDALFMSVFFLPSGQQGQVSEIATIATFILGVPLYLFTIRRSDAVRSLLIKKRIVVAAGLSGTVGSFILMCSGFVGGWALLVVGTVLCALYMAFAGLAWGAVYSSEGAKSAMLYVAGGFAFAFLVDVPLLLMIPVASACFFSLLPLVSSITLLSLEFEKRSYEPRCDVQEIKKHDLSKRARLYFGVSLTALCAVMLIMMGFGYMQHLTSFAPQASDGVVNGGILIQFTRGAVAVLAFLFVIIAPKHASWMYRVGLLAMVAGFSLMPFLYDGRSFEAPGAIIIGGYTIFDILSWVIFSQVAHTRSREPVKTIAVMRFAVSVCYTVGALVAIVLSSMIPTSEHVFGEAIFVGYLLTVAIVLLLSSKEVWELFAPEIVEHPVANIEGRSSDRLHDRCEEWGFTQREGEIIELLVIGRTQPWIAENLSISENTVNTHVRRIYQKMGVHSRQELIDLILDPVSHDSGDASVASR